MKKKYLTPTTKTLRMALSPVMTVSFELDHNDEIDNTDDLKVSPIF